MTIDPPKEEKQRSGFLDGLPSSEEVPLTEIPPDEAVETKSEKPVVEMPPEAEVENSSVAEEVIPEPVQTSVQEVAVPEPIPEWADEIKKSIIKMVGDYYKQITDDSYRKSFDKQADVVMSSIIAGIAKGEATEDYIEEQLATWLKPQESGENEPYFFELRAALTRSISSLVDKLSKTTL